MGDQLWWISVGHGTVFSYACFSHAGPRYPKNSVPPSSSRRVSLQRLGALLFSGGRVCHDPSDVTLLDGRFDSCRFCATWTGPIQCSPISHLEPIVLLRRVGCETVMWMVYKVSLVFELVFTGLPYRPLRLREVFQWMRNLS